MTLNFNSNSASSSNSASISVNFSLSNSATTSVIGPSFYSFYNFANFADWTESVWCPRVHDVDLHASEKSVNGRIRDRRKLLKERPKAPCYGHGGHKGRFLTLNGRKMRVR